MNASEFYNQFLKNMQQLENIYYGDAAKFTSAVTRTINQIIKNANLTPENEYYRIDIIGWKYQNNDAKPEAKTAELNWHQWDLEIAVEHENNPVDWTDELTKLIHIRCPLKVVIGYNYWDCREELEQKKLAYAAKWIQHIKAFDPSAKEEYLIILGNTYSKNGKIKSETPDYRGYLYDYKTSQFIQLKDDEK